MQPKIDRFEEDKVRPLLFKLEILAKNLNSYSFVHKDLEDQLQKLNVKTSRFNRQLGQLQEQIQKLANQEQKDSHSA